MEVSKIITILTMEVILVNAWTDAPNAIATCVSTRSMDPGLALQKGLKQKENMNRRPLRIISLLLILVLIIGMLASCSQPSKNRYEGEFLLLFDTATRVIGYTETKEEFSTYMDQFYAELETYHQLYDIYNDYEGVNNLKTINDMAGIGPVEVDQRIIDMLKFSLEVADWSQGKVNVALGAVLRIWHDYREEGISIPSMEELRPASEHVNIEDLVIDEENSTVFLKDPEMRLDVGGVAKGYAVEMVGQYIVGQGLEDVVISVGGNVRTFGSRGKPGDLWRIGVQSPDKSSENLLMVEITGKSLVTSGDYIRYYEVDGKAYHHIIDPETLMPADYFTAVTILCQDSGMADALSTYLYMVPFEEGLDFIEGLDDAEALWIFKDGSQKTSSGFQSYVVSD